MSLMMFAFILLLECVCVREETTRLKKDKNAAWVGWKGWEKSLLREKDRACRGDLQVLMETCRNQEKDFVESLLYEAFELNERKEFVFFMVWCLQPWPLSCWVRFLHARGCFLKWDTFNLHPEIRFKKTKSSAKFFIFFPPCVMMGYY